MLSVAKELNLYFTFPRFVWWSWGMLKSNQRSTNSDRRLLVLLQQLLWWLWRRGRRLQFHQRTSDNNNDCDWRICFHGGVIIWCLGRMGCSTGAKTYFLLKCNHVSVSRISHQIRKTWFCGTAILLVGQFLLTITLFQSCDHSSWSICCTHAPSQSFVCWVAVIWKILDYPQ